jgi:hypothetical protein
MRRRFVTTAENIQHPGLESIKRVGTGLAFILYPLFAGFAFAAHPNLLSLEIGGDVYTKIDNFHNNQLLYFAHFTMLMGVPLLIIIATRFMSMLKERGAWLGFIGGVLGVFGAVVLAIDKTALCLVMSAFDTLPEEQFFQLVPGIEALFDFRGYLGILWLMALLPLGFLILGIGLYRERAIPRWQSVALIVAMMGTLVAAAVDIDLFGLVATVILAFSFFPLGVDLIRKPEQSADQRAQVARLA